MHKDGIPVAFCDKDGWPAMGTFDYINLRLNGYDFHRALMAGEEAWTDNKVKKVFDLWRELMPYYQKGALGRTWEEAGQGLQKRRTGMAVFGMPHPGQQFPADERDDIDFFAFPEIDPAYGQDAVEAPIDGFLIADKAKNVDAGKDLLAWLGTPGAEEVYLKGDPNNVAVNDGADTSGYSALQKKSAELVSGAEQISQFLDRDTRPDFAQTVMIKALQDFIDDPNDVDGLVNSIERQKKDIFAQDVS
jgi:multiple sugar transport system substrate-binding protein